eukprot:gene13080-biopygen23020
MPAPRPRHPKPKKMPIARTMPAPVSCSPRNNRRSPESWGGPNTLELVCFGLVGC